MSVAEADETQSVVEDGGQGPGAPTPLNVLEARLTLLEKYGAFNTNLAYRVSPVYQLEISSSLLMEDSIQSSLWHTRRYHYRSLVSITFTYLAGHGGFWNRSKAYRSRKRPRY